MKSAIPAKEDNLTYEPFYLMGIDIAPIESHITEESLNELTRDNAQLLVNNIFKLPRQKTDVGAACVLPEFAKVYRLPRTQPIPKAQAKTRWEKFAQEKGIVKRKRSRMVYDEVEKDYAPRWGAYSIKNRAIDREIIKEVKAGDDPFADPWAKDRSARKLVQAKQKMREIRNTLERGNATTEQQKGKDAFTNRKKEKKPVGKRPKLQNRK